MKNTNKEDIIIVALCLLFFAAIVGAILNCLVFPIGYIFVHECEQFLCSHHYPMTWSSFFAITILVYIVLCLIMLLAYAADDGTSTPRRTRKNKQRSYYDSGRETDYYDSDMEGAPGYFGGD